MHELEFEIGYEPSMDILTAAQTAYNLVNAAYFPHTMPRALLGMRNLDRDDLWDMELRLLKEQSPLSLTGLFRAKISRELEGREVSALVREVVHRDIFAADAVIKVAHLLHLKGLREAEEGQKSNLDKREGAELSLSRAALIVRTLAHNVIRPSAVVNPFRRSDKWEKALVVTGKALEIYSANRKKFFVTISHGEVDAMVPPVDLCLEDAVKATTDLYLNL